MRSRFFLLLLALLGAACGQSGTAASDSTTVEPTIAAAPTTTSSSSTPVTTATPDDPLRESFREEWVIETNGGVITALGEHTADADRWLEIYGRDPESWNREVIVMGNEAWNRYFGEDWALVAADDAIVSDLLNGHPFEVSDVVGVFEPGAPDTYEGRAVATYSASGPVVAGFSGIDPETIVAANAEVAIFADDTFATYVLSYERADGQWARLTYRTYDFGTPITIERPE